MFVDDRFIKSVPKSVHSLDLTGNKIDCRICKILTFRGLVIDKCFDGNASQVRMLTRVTELKDLINRQGLGVQSLGTNCNTQILPHNRNL